MRTESKFAVFSNNVKGLFTSVTLETVIKTGLYVELRSPDKHKKLIFGYICEFSSNLQG